MKFDKKKLKDTIIAELHQNFAKDLETATKREIFEAVVYAVMHVVTDQWIKTKDTYAKKNTKQAYYLSAEFLMGRALGNNLANLMIVDEVKEVLNEIDFDLNTIEDEEFDAGLGNGGLGRLAACFLDSLATLELPGHGYGIRYRYGIFEQRIENGRQVEYPDMWLRYGDPWSIKREDESVEVIFGGHVVVNTDETGREYYDIEGGEVIRAIPVDTPVVGYGNNTVNTLRLWEAESPEEFNLQLFNDGHYLESVEKQNRAQDISRVLYPNDNTNPGKLLRLRQQYFFVSASLQDVIRKYRAKFGDDFSKFAELNTFQLNDTHPVVAIPELMRIFMDDMKMEWDEAWKIVTQVCAYTNHTIMVEALEKWSMTLFSSNLPRVYQIIEEINRRFMFELSKAYPGEYDKHHRMSIIRDGIIDMAWLAIVGSHSVNGVAQLHTDILKETVLREWYEFFTKKFNNKTNGVTQRRWLLKCNPKLAQLISDKIGDQWIVKLDELKKLEEFTKDKDFVKQFMDIKRDNKIKLGEYIEKHNNVKVNPDSIFDVQVKRLHEYKRQLMDVLYIMHLYNKLKENPSLDVQPRTFIFGAKAASGYHRAKLIIKLINNVADKINNDSAINDKIKVIFLANYRVSLAEKIIPAADLSVQISTAGKEASGTGNMKFMLNGAPTIGTMDGANIEIVEQVGEENAFIFGLRAEEVKEMNRHHAYNPRDIYDSNRELRKVINQLIDGTYSGNDRKEVFREIYDSLMYGVEGNPADQYFVLKDFPEYVLAQDKVDNAYRDKKKWAEMCILNTANAGKFSSDRTIQQYADEIWKIKRTPIK